MRIPDRSHAWLVATLALPLTIAFATCSLDQQGLGGTGDGAAGTSGPMDAAGLGGAGGGSAGSAGAAGASLDASGTGGLGGPAGVAGAGGTTGAAGTTGEAGAAGTGDAGTSGAAGTAGGAGTTGIAGVAGTAGTAGTAGLAGTTGAAGTTGVAGAAGTTGVAGTTGTTGVAGTTGAAGTTGTGGTSPGCNAATCPTGCCREGQCVTTTSAQACGTGGQQCRSCGPCFRCGSARCEPIPDAEWRVTCVSAVIAPMKPNGAVWDTTSTSTPGTWPDTYCRFAVDNNQGRSSSTENDTLTPMWDDNVTPTSGPDVTSSLLMSENRWSITIVDEDAPMAHDEVCRVPSRLTADDLERGTATLSSGSCTQIHLAFSCDD